MVSNSSALAFTMDYMLFIISSGDITKERYSSFIHNGWCVFISEVTRIEYEEKELNQTVKLNLQAHLSLITKNQVR